MKTRKKSGGKKRSHLAAQETPPVPKSILAERSGGRVHFSPDVVARAKPKSPTSAAKTLGSTPPSALRTGTLRSTGPDGSTTTEEAVSPASTTLSSPIVLEERVDGVVDGDELQTTSETPVSALESTQESSLSRSSTRRRGGRRRSIPSHIQISSQKKHVKNGKRGVVEEAEESENRPLKRNRRSSRIKNHK